MVYLLPNFTWREIFFSLSQRKLVGKIWCPYEPFPSNIEGPGGENTPKLAQKQPFLNENRPFDSKISNGDQFLVPSLREDL